MKKLKIAFILNVFALLAACETLAQSISPPPPPPFCGKPEPDTTLAGVYHIVEQMPEFPTGHSGLFKYLNDSLRYPALAQENAIGGKVYIRFMVDTLGALTHIVVKRGLHGGCSEEAMRLVRAMPKWIPGRQGGKPVKVFYTLQIRFGFKE